MIIINGQQLNDAQVLTLRAAVTSFLSDLQRLDMGLIGLRYEERCKEILKLMEVI